MGTHEQVGSLNFSRGSLSFWGGGGRVQTIFSIFTGRDYFHYFRGPPFPRHKGTFAQAHRKNGTFQSKLLKSNNRTSNLVSFMFKMHFRCYQCVFINSECSVRDGFKKKEELMEFSMKGPDPASQYP